MERVHNISHKFHSSMATVVVVSTWLFIVGCSSCSSNGCDAVFETTNLTVRTNFPTIPRGTNAAVRAIEVHVKKPAVSGGDLLVQRATRTDDGAQIIDILFSELFDYSAPYHVEILAVRGDALAEKLFEYDIVLPHPEPIEVPVPLL